MKTKITELLGIEYPIVQGAMAWIAEHHLAAAVSKAGGLGIIAGGAAPVDYIRDEIHKARAITDKPLGMNIMLLSPNADDLAQLAIDEKIDSRGPVSSSFTDLERLVESRYTSSGSRTMEFPMP